MYMCVWNCTEKKCIYTYIYYIYTDIYRKRARIYIYMHIHYIIYIYLESVTEYGPHSSSKIRLFFTVIIENMLYVVLTHIPSDSLSLSLYTYIQQHVSDQMSCKKFLDILIFEHK